MKQVTVAGVTFYVELEDKFVKESTQVEIFNAKQEHITTVFIEGDADLSEDDLTLKDVILDVLL